MMKLENSIELLKLANQRSRVLFKVVLSSLILKFEVSFELSVIFEIWKIFRALANFKHYSVILSNSSEKSKRDVIQHQSWLRCSSCSNCYSLTHRPIDEHLD